MWNLNLLGELSGEYIIVVSSAIQLSIMLSLFNRSLLHGSGLPTPNTRGLRVSIAAQ